MLENLLNHRSIRKFKNQEIPQDIVTSILEAASRASNTGNMQWYSIIATKDVALKQKLQAECHFNQGMVSQAPLVLTFCADINRFNKWCVARNAEPGYDNFLSFYTATIDAVIAAQNACLAAEHHGLGICYLGTTNYTAKKMIEILQLPRGVVPVTTVVVGYADEIPDLTDRLPLDAIVHLETYKDYTTGDINKHYKAKEELEFHKNLVKINNTESLAHIFTQKRYPKQNNELFSRSLLEILKEQGFMNQ